MRAGIDISKELRQAPDGVWYVRPYLGTDPVTGRPLRPYKSFPRARGRAEALRLAAAWFDGVRRVGEMGSMATLTQLLDAYVDGLESADAPANTVRTYRNFARHVGHLGRMRASEVTPVMVDALYSELRREGLGGRSLSAMHAFLSGFFRQMVGMGALPSNPCEWVTRPRWVRAGARGFDEAEAAELLEVLVSAMHDGHRLRRVVAICAITSLYGGLRVGEASALRWCDARRRQGRILVGGTVVESKGRVARQPYPKGKKQGLVYMPPDWWQILSEWRSLQLGRGIRCRAGDPVATSTGGWARPSDVSKGFRALAAGAGLGSDCRYQTLRHTMATLMLANNEDPDRVRERLRHSDITTTYREYRHAMPSRDEEAVDRYAAALRRGYGDWDDG